MASKSSTEVRFSIGGLIMLLARRTKEAQKTDVSGITDGLDYRRWSII